MKLTNPNRREAAVERIKSSQIQVDSGSMAHLIIDTWIRLRLAHYPPKPWLMDWLLAARNRRSYTAVYSHQDEMAPCLFPRNRKHSG